MHPPPPTIAFLGSGRMATAMVSGLLRSGSLPATHMRCLGANDGTGEALSQATGIALARNLPDLLQGADVLVLAIKPQQLGAIPGDLAQLSASRMVLSILAGTSLATLALRLPKARNIVRAMPNTPGQIGCGISAYAPASSLAPADASAVRMILGSLGEVIPVQETQLDAVTGLSGSGPAYVFEFVAALRDGGVAAGLDPEMALRLALHTVLGSAQLLASSKDSPEVQRDRVTSPGGTTLAGLNVMRERAFSDCVIATVLAARDRSQELARIQDPPA